MTIAPVIALYGAFLLGRAQLSGRSGRWSRPELVTSLVVQDGGWAGRISNVFSLALLAPVAVRLWGVRLAIVAFAAGGLGGELAGLLWQHVGAGNSVACMGLAAALAVYTRRWGAPPFRIAAVVVALAGLALVPARDIHGAAFAVGLVVLALVSVDDDAPRTHATA